MVIQSPHMRACAFLIRPQASIMAWPICSSFSPSLTATLSLMAERRRQCAPFKALSN